MTRKGIHIDRIASAWLIRRFVDADARFKFVPAKDYKPDAPAIVTKVTEPLSPSTEEPRNKVVEPPPPTKEIKPSRKRTRQHGRLSQPDLRGHG